MNFLNIRAFEEAPIANNPFPHFIANDVILPAVSKVLQNSFPHTKHFGSIPPFLLRPKADFQAFLKELKGKTLKTLISKKFNQDFSHASTQVTVRSHCRATDGKIHTDAREKTVTVLLYLSELSTQEKDPGGCLRLLRSSSSLEDYAHEIRPQFGTFLCFLNSPAAWHGHVPYAGPRRVLQLNYVRDNAYVRKENLRHTLSYALKVIRTRKR